MTRLSQFLGVSGLAGGYEVVTVGDRIAVFRNHRAAGDRVVTGLQRFVSKPGRTVRIALARTADYEILYLYDARDGFGYALNLTDPDLSEWGYGPFGDRACNRGARSSKKEVRA